MSLRNWFARTPGNSFGIGRRSLYISPKQLVSFEPYLHHARYTCIFIYSLHDFWNEISAEEGGDLKDFISKVKTFTNLTKISYISLKYHQYQDQRLTVLFRSIVIMPHKTRQIIASQHYILSIPGSKALCLPQLHSHYAILAFHQLQDSKAF